MAPVSLKTGLRLDCLEDERLVEHARVGNSQATELLLRKYRSLVECKAGSYYLAGGEVEDVVQEGMIGLYRAICDYRGGKSASFRTFAELCVTRRIISAIKSATRNKHSVLTDCMSLDAEVCEDGSSIIELIPDTTAADPEQLLLENCKLKSLRVRVHGDLSKLELAVLKRYMDGRRYHEIARELRCSPKTVDNALQRAKRKVSERLIELN